MTKVDDLASVRTGDKGDMLILSVIGRSDDAYRLLRERLTAEVVGRRFGYSVPGQAVKRHEMDGVQCLIFTLKGLLGGGVTGSPVLDGHGKCLSFHLLGLEV